MEVRVWSMLVGFGRMDRSAGLILRPVGGISLGAAANLAASAGWKIVG